MATVKTKFRTPSSAAKEGTLFYQVIHNRTVRQIHTDYRLYPREWDAASRAIILSSEATQQRMDRIASMRTVVQDDVRYLKSIISYLERTGGDYTADDVVSRFNSKVRIHCLISFAGDLVSQFRRLGRQCTADTYTTVLNSFIRFREGRDVVLDDVDSDLMTAYESYLRAMGICQNSISFYMRNLRAIYNRAVDKGLTVQRYPFKHVYTGIDKTPKRAVPMEIIRRIRDMDLSRSKPMDYARDIFMFSFYTRGMSFVDIAFLKKKDLQNGILSYRRQKTGQQLYIKWEQPMQDVVDRYDTAGSPYLLPIIRDAGKDERRQYKSAAHRINANLRKIGELLGLGIPLTAYVARHGWASIAKSNNIPVATISEAMGHDSENTTRIYLASLDTSAVDKANSIILESL